MEKTPGFNLLKIRQRLKLRREDLAHHSRLCYHTICRCESENRWPTQFARRLAYQESLRDLMRQAGLSPDAIRAAGIPDFLATVHAEIDHIDGSEQARTSAHPIAERRDTFIPPRPPPTPSIPGRGPGFFAR